MNARCCLRAARRFAANASALKRPNKFFKEAKVVPSKGSETLSYNILLDQRKLKSPSGKIFQTVNASFESFKISQPVILFSRKLRLSGYSTRLDEIPEWHWEHCLIFTFSEKKTESEHLAYAICQEWNLQEKVLRLDHMRLTGLFFTALDNPFSLQKKDVVKSTMEYLDTDTILYRNDENERLKALQKERWDPVLEWASREYALSIKPSLNVAQEAEVSPESRSNLERHLLGYNFFALTGLQYAVGSLKSLLLSLAAISHRLEAPEAVELALLEQRFQTDVWGKVEWAHDVEFEDLTSRLAAAVLFVNFTSNIYRKHAK